MTLATACVEVCVAMFICMIPLATTGTINHHANSWITAEMRLVSGGVQPFPEDDDEAKSAGTQEQEATLRHVDHLRQLTEMLLLARRYVNRLDKLGRGPRDHDFSAKSRKRWKRQKQPDPLAHARDGQQRISLVHDCCDDVG
jgi:hypothetical protein